MWSKVLQVYTDACTGSELCLNVHAIHRWKLHSSWVTEVSSTR